MVLSNDDGRVETSVLLFKGRDRISNCTSLHDVESHLKTPSCQRHDIWEVVLNVRHLNEYLYWSPSENLNWYTDRDNISLTKSCEYFGNHKWKHLQREYLSLELSGIYDCYNYKIIFISKRTSISMFSTEYYGCIWSFCKWFYKLHEQKKVSGRGLEGRVCRCDIFLAFMYLISMYVMNNKFSHEIDVSKCMRLFLSIATCIVNNI